MVKPRKTYICQACGAVTVKWAGRCDNCGTWNSIVEEAVNPPLPGRGHANQPKGEAAALVGLEGDGATPPRRSCGISELDRVTGGGLVAGSVILIGGDPGIGKSTLVLQTLAKIAGQGEPVIYISGEEAIAQVRLRAKRLNLANAPVLLAAQTNLGDILATIGAVQRPGVIAVDSIQTLWSPSIDAAPGTVSQLRAGTEAMVRLAKRRDACVLLIGHVTKEGQIAGPRLIEHMVDTVLYFEGDRGHQYRIVRAVKNRFGPTDEIGVFEMSDSGLCEVTNPSRLFIGNRDEKAVGSAIFAGIEGTRPLLVEIQALISPSTLGTPRRAVVGWDASRLAMVLAVLEAHCGVSMANRDVYLNVAGGLRIREPAADLAVAAALLSSLTATALPLHAAFFGEVGLSGSLRPVTLAKARLKEAAKLGFTAAIVPLAIQDSVRAARPEIHGLSNLSALIGWMKNRPAVPQG